jgi:ParB-like chromosome segregation protein Spo0J
MGVKKKKTKDRKLRLVKLPAASTPVDISTPKRDVHVVSVELAKLTPYKNNPRKNDHAIDRLVASIQEFGFKIPILAKSDGSVIDGHLRLKAAEKLNLKEVPVILCDEWSEAQVKAFRLMANRSVGWAEWDTDLLKLEFEDLEMLDFDLALTGFDPKEIEELLPQETSDAPDGDGGGSLEEQFQILITCDHEQQQAELLQEFLAKGLTCRALTV